MKHHNAKFAFYIVYKTYNASNICCEGIKARLKAKNRNKRIHLVIL
jgi:hypothetical protein